MIALTIHVPDDLASNDTHKLEALAHEALIGYLEAAGGDIARVASDYVKAACLRSSLSVFTETLAHLTRNILTQLADAICT